MANFNDTPLALALREGSLDELNRLASQAEAVSLSGTNLRGADLRKANLRKADLRDAYCHSTDLPEARTTNRSPRPTLKMYSGGALESAHDRTMANGCWPFVSVSRAGDPNATGAEAFLTKRSFLDFRRTRPAVFGGAWAVGT